MNNERQTVDTVDQTSSVTLLGVAIAGSLLMLAAYWVLGG